MELCLWCSYYWKIIFYIPNSSLFPKQCVCLPGKTTELTINTSCMFCFVFMFSWKQFLMKTVWCKTSGLLTNCCWAKRCEMFLGSSDASHSVQTTQWIKLFADISEEERLHIFVAWSTTGNAVIVLLSANMMTCHSWFGEYVQVFFLPCFASVNCFIFSLLKWLIWPSHCTNYTSVTTSQLHLCKHFFFKYPRHFKLSLRCLEGRGNSYLVT